MRTPLIAAIAALAIGSLSACSDKAQDNLENAGSAIGNDVTRAVDNAGASIDNGLDRAGHAIDNGADRIGAATDNAAVDAKREAGEVKSNVGTTLEKAGNDLKKE